MDNPLGKASVKTRVINDTRTRRLSFGTIENENQIKIRGVAQFQAAEFSIADHSETRVIGLRFTMPLYEFCPRDRHGLLNYDLREVGEVVADLHYRQGAAELTGRHAQNHRISDAAQRGHLRF